MICKCKASVKSSHLLLQAWGGEKEAKPVAADVCGQGGGQRLCLLAREPFAPFFGLDHMEAGL